MRSEDGTRLSETADLEGKGRGLYYISGFFGEAEENHHTLSQDGTY
jgi:hypothetical protein